MSEFSEMMKVRADITKKLNVMARKVEGVTTFLLTGSDEHTPEEAYYVVASSDADAREKIVDDLDFLIREFLRPSQGLRSEEDGRVIIQYLFENGLKARVTLCAEDHLPVSEWWVPYLDRNRAAELSCPAEKKKPSDPTCEKPEEAVPASKEPSSAPVFTPEPEQNPAPERSERELWNYFYGKVNNAKHAIDGGAVIYACEIIGELRSLLIKMICEANGITEDYLHCIDLLPENHCNAILRTYPSKPEKANMISALATELRIFENLMKRSAR